MPAWNLAFDLIAAPYVSLPPYLYKFFDQQ